MRDTLDSDYLHSEEIGTIHSHRAVLFPSL